MSISRGEISLKGVYDKNGQTIDVTEEHFFSDSCIADSIKAVKKAGLIRAPTYLHVQGRANALENDPLWDYWFDTYGERLLIVDKEGINGNKGQLYVVSLQNCGIFSNNPHRIRTAIQEQRLKDGQIPLDQETDVNAFLEAINNTNYTKEFQQKGWTKSGQLYVFKSFEEFDDASKKDHFLVGLPAYIVLRKYEEAKQTLVGVQDIFAQLNNQNLIIESGGRSQLDKMLGKAIDFSWEKFGSSLDYYTNVDYYYNIGYVNFGSVVLIDSKNNGICGYILKDRGSSVGINVDRFTKCVETVEETNLEKIITQKIDQISQELQLPNGLVESLEEEGYNFLYLDAMLRKGLDLGKSAPFINGNYIQVVLWGKNARRALDKHYNKQTFDQHVNILKRLFKSHFKSVPTISLIGNWKDITENTDLGKYLSCVILQKRKK